MKKYIDTYIQSVARDNKQFIADGGYKSIADYIISNAESGLGYYEFFDNSELEDDEPSEEQIDEFKKYLNENYNYIPE